MRGFFYAYNYAGTQGGLPEQRGQPHKGGCPSNGVSQRGLDIRRHPPEQLLTH